MVKNQEISGFRRFYRIFRWFVLLALILIIILALKRPGDVPDGADPVKAPEQAREFEYKLQQLQEAHSRGDPGVKVEFSSGEINAFLARAMAQGAGASGKGSPPAQSDTQAGIKDFRVRLGDDAIVAYFVTDFHGKDLAITLSGQPGIANGSLSFTPTGFKLGSLPIPIGLVDGTIQRRLADPEMQENLKVPDFIEEMRVQNGQLVMIGK